MASQGRAADVDSAGVYLGLGLEDLNYGNLERAAPREAAARERGGRKAGMKITIIENGPIILDTKDRLPIDAGGAKEEKEGPVFLCRCGQSSNKPFCDGTHRKVGFEGAPGEILIP